MQVPLWKLTAEQETVPAWHFGFWLNFLNLNFVVFPPLFGLFLWWSFVVYLSQCWACLAPSAPWDGAGGKSSCATGSAAAPCPLQPFLGRGVRDRLCWHWRRLDLTCLEGDVSVAGPIKRFNKQPEGSSSALVSYDRGQGLLQSPFQPASGCGSSGFTALPWAFILPLL